MLLIIYLTISRRKRGDYKLVLQYRLVITEPEAPICFSINFEVFSNNNQLNFTKIHFKFITVYIEKQN